MRRRKVSVWFTLWQSVIGFAERRVAPPPPSLASACRHLAWRLHLGSWLSLLGWIVCAADGAEMESTMLYWTYGVLPFLLVSGLFAALARGLQALAIFLDRVDRLPE